MKIKFLPLFLLTLWAVPAWGGSDRSSQMLMSLKTSLSDISSIGGNFVQEKRLNYLNQPVRSAGVFYFSKPDSLHWEYLSPAVSGLEIKGGQIRAWTGPPEARKNQPEAMARAARLAAGQVMLWMNLEPEAILAAYEVEILTDKPLKLLVTPKRASARKLINSITVEFNTDLRTVRQVSLREPEGRTDITFSRVSLNQSPSGFK